MGDRLSRSCSGGTTAIKLVGHDEDLGKIIKGWILEERRTL